MVLMLMPLITVALDLQRRYKQSLAPIISRLSKGFASLPDEVLPVIFEFAVRAEGAMGTMQAKCLSHVSRRFREITLGEQSLWSTLRSSASMAELETAVSRSSTDTDLHVFIHIHRQ